jgi:hypothetical protein
MQAGHAVHSLDVNASAAAAVTAIRGAFFNVLFAKEGDASVTAGTGVNR